MLRHPSQIGVREKYLIAVQNVSATEGTGVGNGGTGAFTLNSGAFIDVGYVATASEVTAAGNNFNRVAITAGTLYRDMGRSITVVDDDGNHLALYRNVQRVDGSTTEGVPSDADYSANIYLRVWAADGDNIGVARLG